MKDDEKTPEEGKEADKSTTDEKKVGVYGEAPEIIDRDEVYVN